MMAARCEHYRIQRYAHIEGEAREGEGVSAYALLADNARMCCAPVRWVPPVKSLEQRLDNWSECWAKRIRATLTAKGVWSTSRGYGQAWHWDSSDGHDARGVAIAAAPSAPSGVDVADAQAVELGVSALDTYHHFILKGHYVRKWSPEKTMRMARQFGGVGNARQRSTDADYLAALGMSRALLADVVDRPAVIRRERAAKAVALVLELPDWGVES